jgi:hypothetical protein
MESSTGYLAKENKNKYYQVKDERFNMEEWENISTLLQWYDQYVIQWMSDTHSHRNEHSIINKSELIVRFSLGMHA